jgi:hypothetical protein
MTLLDRLWNARKAILAAVGAAVTAFTAVIAALPPGSGLSAISLQGWSAIAVAALGTTGAVYAVTNKPLPAPVEVLPDVAGPEPSR